jgi:hypothetical protein
VRVYLIGSLRNPRVPQIGKELRQAGHVVFDDWFAAGPEADDAWQRYEQSVGRTYHQALHGAAAQHVFQFDLEHLKWAEGVVLVTPAGKSGHLELGWAIGQGKKGYILLDAPVERWDVMYAFTHGVFDSVTALERSIA